MARDDLMYVLKRMTRHWWAGLATSFTCRCCGRALSAPASVAAGMGRRCADGECTCHG